MVIPSASQANPRPRVCAAILRGEAVLMVHHIHEDGRDFWTLPGGGVEPGETLSEAAVREVLEETCLRVSVIRKLFERCYSMGIETCFLAETETGQEPCLGADPEEQHLPGDQRSLRGVSWLPLANIGEHPQCLRLLKALSKTEPG